MIAKEINMATPLIRIAILVFFKYNTVRIFKKGDDIMVAGIMFSPDLINGLFETVGGFTSFLNCWQLYKDKQVKGVVWQLTIFYTLWGLWNLYYYPHLGQWFSFAGGCIIVMGNLLWIIQVLYYFKHPPKNIES